MGTRFGRGKKVLVLGVEGKRGGGGEGTGAGSWGYRQTEDGCAEHGGEGLGRTGGDLVLRCVHTGGCCRIGQPLTLGTGSEGGEKEGAAFQGKMWDRGRGGAKSIAG